MRRTDRITRVLVATALAAVVAGPGCGPEGGSSPDLARDTSAEPIVLRTWTLLGTHSASQVASRHPEISGVASSILYGIETYSFTYDTFDADGQAVIASGAILVPQVVSGFGGGGPFPVLAYHHGTLFPDEEGYAPSHDHPDNFETWFTAAVLAASGRVVCAPDYVGYGASSGIEHSYEHAESQAIAVVDAIRATLELMSELGVSSANRLFLAGYSEGGSAALATHRALEESASPPLLPSLTVALAGAYSKTAFSDVLLGSSQPQPSLRPAVWTIRTYDRLHDLDRPLVSYFLEPWASSLASDPFGPVPQVPTQLFQPAFTAGVIGRSDPEFSAALAANDVHEWAPLAPVRLVHGTDDAVVPYFLSEVAVARMAELGGDVALETLAGLDHVESEREFARVILELIETPTSVRE